MSHDADHKQCAPSIVTSHFVEPRSHPPCHLLVALAFRERRGDVGCALSHDYVKAVIKVDVPIGPESALDLFTSNQLAGPLEQETKASRRPVRSALPIALQP
jgi:hypothetical protein